MKRIIVEIREVYGEPLYFPANLTSRLFASLIKQEAFTKQDLDIIKALGYVVEDCKIS